MQTLVEACFYATPWVMTGLAPSLDPAQRKRQEFVAMLRDRLYGPCDRGRVLRDAALEIEYYARQQRSLTRYKALIHSLHQGEAVNDRAANALEVLWGLR